MIPIPYHLRHLAKLESDKENTITVSIHCICGNDTFYVYENCFTKEEEALMKPYYDALEYLAVGGYASTTTKDKDGTIHHWKLWDEKGNRKEEVTMPEQPYFVGVQVIKAVCAKCNEEHIIFDDRVNGYNGMVSDKEKKVIEYMPHFKRKNRLPHRILIWIENDESLEKFNRNTLMNYDEKSYSDSYSWISIYGINEIGKKRKLYDIETA